MSTNKNLTKKLILSISAIVMFILANIGIMKLNDNKVTVSASETSKLSITNSEFANNTNQSYPYTTPSGYTAYVYDEEVSSNQKNENCGVINLRDEEYATRFKDALDHNPDDYCLMLTSSDASLKFGYRTSSSLTFSAYSNYVVSARVYTESSTQIGNLALYDEDGNIYAEFDNISSNRTWTTYNLVVSTGNSELNLTIGLNIKGKGTILFDSISAMQISSNYLQNLSNISENSSSHYKYVTDFDEKSVEYIYTLNNENFVENTIEHGILKETSNTYSISRISTSTADTEMAIESSGYYKSSIVLNHDEEKYSEFATENNLLTVKQNMVYKVTVTAKTENISGNAYLKLTQTNLNSNEEAKNAEITISSDTTSSVNNNYTNYNFYILGNPEKDVTYKFSFALGSTETKAKGSLYIAGIAQSKIDYSTYNSASTTNAKKINLNENLVYSDSSIYLDNANFNAMQIASYDKPYPATPENWQVSAGKNNQYYGVVNTSSAEFIKLTSVVDVVNPYSSETNQNVLFMYNNSNEALSYTSNSKSLTANTIHKFAIKVQSQNAPIKVSLVATKNDKEFELVSKSIQTGVQNWQWVELMVKTGFEDIDVSLKLTIESKNIQSYAYIDDARFDYLTAPTQAEFDTAIDKVNLKNLLASKDFFDLPNEEGIITEFIDIENANNLQNYVIDETSFKSINTNNVMLIKAYDDKFYTVKSITGFKLKQDRLYKISVSVYTQNIGTNDEETDLNKVGASIKLSSFDKTFTCVVSNNAWKTYTFYVKPDSDTTTNLEISIGSEEVNAKGDVFFGNIQITTDAEDTFGTENYDENLNYEFEVLSEKENVKILKTVQVNEDTDNETEDNTNSETKEKTKLDKQTLLYLIPSIIFAVAIVLAVVCTLVRKIKWKKPSKKAKKSDYDRTKTVNKQVYARRAAVLRETKIRELSKKLEDLSNERNKYEEEYKTTLSKIRELKIKRGDKIEIAKLEKDLKKNQKSSASIGVSINKVSRELEYAKTEPYLQALIKRLHQEKLENYNPDENN